MSFTKVLKKLESNVDLTKDDLLIIFHDLENKILNDKDIEKLIVLWRKKNEKPHELKGLTEIVFSKQGKINIEKDVVDTCGTGGDKLNTFNISTLSAIVASSLGVKIIKHSGRSTTSISGSVDILGSFNFDIDLEDGLKEECFKKTNLMFVSSQILRENFGRVKSICKQIDIPGFVNLLGPLTNPYKTKYHLLGVSKFEWGELLAKTLMLVNDENDRETFIVCSRITNNVYLDELSLCGENFFWKISNQELTTDVISPTELGFKFFRIEDLVVKDFSDARNVFEVLLKGKLSENDPKLLTLALNSGTLCFLSKKAKSLKEGFELALLHIKSGKVWEHFQSFLNCSKRITDYN